MLLHRDYFPAINSLPDDVYAMVDRYNNCDDIAINFAVSDALDDASGVCVVPQKYAKIDKRGKRFKGLQASDAHHSNRTRCLNELATMYGRMPLRYSDAFVVAMRL
ncbi:PREDICTED: exostosin-like 2 [Priapulus caudatus]|uniref:Exostosin-like 2 n=1 Tax=Priapulus caudatus TaxID=37621 RepID=A0ABM1F0M6_PRICU|nr:PREDICTED: exostosin-like 2 [Priapulus caudatus]